MTETEKNDAGKAPQEPAPEQPAEPKAPTRKRPAAKPKARVLKPGRRIFPAGWETKR
jgi:hypothetical protein